MATLRGGTDKTDALPTYSVVQALSDLSMGEVRGMDDDTLRKLETLCDHWAQLAAAERARRAEQ
jgi:hypothetical protein